VGKTFWLKRFFRVFVVASALLLLVQVIKGFSIADGARFALLWGLISAAIFTTTGYLRYRRNPACMLPNSKQH